MYMSLIESWFPFRDFGEADLVYAMYSKMQKNIKILSTLITSPDADDENSSGSFIFDFENLMSTGIETKSNDNDKFLLDWL